MKKFIFKNFHLILFLGVISLIFHSWLTMKVLCKGDCLYFFPENLRSFFSQPWFWNTSPTGSGLGYFALPTLSFSPPPFLLGFFYHFFKFPFEVIEKIVWFFPFILLSSWGMFSLSRVFNLTRVGAFFASLFYLINTYILLVVDGGQVGIALAYSFIPSTLAFFIEGLRKGRKKKIWAGLFFALSGFFDLRATYLIFGLAFFYGLFFLLEEKHKRQSIFDLLSSFSALLLIFLGLHSFWIAPSLLTRNTTTSLFYTQSFQVDFLSWMNLLNGLFLFQPHWPTNLFGKINPTPFEFFFIPFLVFLNLFINRRKKEIFYFLFVSLFSIFLIKGSQEPESGLYRWFFLHFPGFVMFRDPSKFYIPLSLSYSLLLAFSLEKINQKIKTLRHRILSPLFLSITLVYFLYLIKPVIFGEMLGTFKPQSVPQDYLEIKKLISKDEDFFRSVWYPQKREFSYSSPTHPALDATLDLFHLRPFDIAIGGTYDMFSYLEHPFSRQLFDILGIKYVFASDSLKKYPLSESEIKDKKRLLSVLERTFWLEKLNIGEEINSFRTMTSSDHFFTQDKTFWVEGGDNLYWILDTFSDFLLKKLGLVFLDDLQELPKFQEIKNSDYLVFNNKEWTDLAFLQAARKYFISPVEKIGDQKLPDKSWLLKKNFEFISWRDVLARKGFGNMDFDLRKGFIFADDYPQTLNFSFSSSGEKKTDFYVRYFSNRLGGKFLIKIDGRPIEVLETKSFRDNFTWEKINSLEIQKGKHQMTLENLEGFNAINVFALVPQGEMENYQKLVKEKINQTQTIYFYESGEATKSGGLNFAKRGEFEVFVRVLPQPRINHLELQIGNQIFERAIDPELKTGKWYSLGKTNLKEGANRITIRSSAVENLVFSPVEEKSFLKFLAEDPDSPVLTWKFVNPTKYLVHVKNNKPFTLIFSESYHPFWQAKIGGQTFPSLPFYSIINGFRISRTGEFDVVVEFAPQRWFLPASVISLVSLLVVVGFLLRNEKKR